MKNFFPVAVLTLFVMAACSSHKHDSGKEWSEMDAFHMTMAECYHPYKDSKDLAPARRLAGQLAIEAGTLAESEIPGSTDQEKMKSMLRQLQKDSEAFSALLSSGASDSTAGASLTALHDEFHKVMEAMHGKKDHAEHD